MRTKLRVEDIDKENMKVSLIVDDESAMRYLEKYSDIPLRADIHKWKDDRSLEQNALLWACIGDICKHMSNSPDKWGVYLKLLREYGEFAILKIETDKLEKFKESWREVEELKEVVEPNGTKCTIVRAYYGSHLLDTTEMSRLLTGVIDEMKIMGIPLPPSKEMKRLIDEVKK